MSYGGKHRYGPEDVNRDMSAALAKMELGRWQGIVFHKIDLGDQALDGQVRPQGDETTLPWPDDQMGRWAMKLLEPNRTFAKVAAWMFGVLLALIAADVMFLVLRK